jgi:D-3-phosphoglycerate dehydrogenase / 2-oxoglutarate reductase
MNLENNEVNMSLKAALVLASFRLPQDLEKCVREKGAEVAVCLDPKTEEELISFCRDADYIISFMGYFPFTPQVFRSLPQCRFFQTLGIGYDAIDLPTVNELGIGIVNLRGFCIEDLAEHSMALILTCARWIPALYNRVKMGKPVMPACDEAVRHMSLLKGKTLGIIGFGGAGRAMVPKAQGFQMQIIACDPYVEKDRFEELNVYKVDLNILLETADYIAIHAALTTENYHMIGTEQLKKMKPGVIIVNTARGAIIDESALYTALKEGRIGGAGLDVTEKEPVSPDNPLLQLENVIITGHNGGTSPESKAATSTQPAEEVARVMRGEWPYGLVNPEVKEKHMARWGKI